MGHRVDGNTLDRDLLCSIHLLTAHLPMRLGIAQQHGFIALQHWRVSRINARGMEHMVVFREAPIDNGRVSPHKHRITVYLRPKTFAMLLLGFSSGLPFLLQSRGMVHL
jgi:hypothetical protein